MKQHKLHKECKECEALKHDINTFRKINQDLINKEWQGLSDNEIDYEFHEMESWQVPMTEEGMDKQERRYDVFVKACKIAEQKLKEKNHETT